MSGEVNVNGPTKLIPIALGLAALVVGFFLAPPTPDAIAGSDDVATLPEGHFTSTDVRPRGVAGVRFQRRNWPRKLLVRDRRC